MQTRIRSNSEGDGTVHRKGRCDGSRAAMILNSLACLYEAELPTLRRASRLNIELAFSRTVLARTSRLCRRHAISLHSSSTRIDTKPDTQSTELSRGSLDCGKHAELHVMPPIEGRLCHRMAISY